MMSASAVADSHPWRRRVRYLLGVVVFATAIAATQALAHILPRLRHHPIRSESLEHLNVHDSFRRCHRALFWKSSVSGGPGSTPLNVRSYVPYPSKGRTVPRPMLISIRGHLVPGPELPVEVRLPSTCSQARICDETPRCSNNICAADEDATQAGIQYHTTSANQSSVSAGSADLTAATNRAI
jgi:hypothetical protein